MGSKESKNYDKKPNHNKNFYDNKNECYHETRKAKKVKRAAFRIHKEEELWDLPWDKFNYEINTLVKLQGIFEDEDPKTREDRRNKNRKDKEGKDGKDGKCDKDHKDGKDGKCDKGHKDGKDGKCDKGHKDGKDGKCDKDHKDGKDGKCDKGCRADEYDKECRKDKCYDGDQYCIEDGESGRDKDEKGMDGKSQEGSQDKKIGGPQDKKPEGPKERQVAFRLHIYTDDSGYNGSIRAMHLKKQKYIESYQLIYFEWLSNSRLLAIFKSDNACCQNDKDKKNNQCKQKKDKMPEYLTVTAVTSMYDDVEPQVHIYSPGVDEIEVKWGGHLVSGEISSACKDQESYIGKENSNKREKMRYSLKN